MKPAYIFLRRVVLLSSMISLKINPLYFFRKIFYGYAIRTVNGSKMFLDLKNDTGISKDLFIFGKREHITTNLMLEEKILNLGDTVLDVGANIGYYALLESRLVGDSGLVFALEPVANNFRILLKNVEMNNLNNIKTFNVAAGSKSGEGEIYVASKGNISSFVFNKDVEYVKKEIVKMVSIDDFVRDNNITPALVRMDVEGYESEIVKGMSNLLLKKPKLLIEVHPHIMKMEEMTGMFEKIQQSGYTQAVVIKERNELWMKRNGMVKASLLYFSSKIEGISHTMGIGKLEIMKLSELQETLGKRRSAFHVLLS